MEVIIIRALSSRFEDVLAVRLLFPEIPLDELHNRLRTGKPLPPFDLEGEGRIESVRRLSKLAQMLVERGITNHVHHLIEEGESASDPMTEIDLELLETVLEGRPTGRLRFADEGRTG